MSESGGFFEPPNPFGGASQGTGDPALWLTRIPLEEPQDSEGSEMVSGDEGSEAFESDDPVQATVDPGSAVGCTHEGISEEATVDTAHEIKTASSTPSVQREGPQAVPALGVSTQGRRSLPDIPLHPRSRVAETAETSQDTAAAGSGLASHGGGSPVIPPVIEGQSFMPTNHRPVRSRLTLVPLDRAEGWYTVEGQRSLRAVYEADYPKWSWWLQSRGPRLPMIMNNRRHFKPSAIRAMYDERSRQILDVYENCGTVISRSYLLPDGTVGLNPVRRERVLKSLGCEIIAVTLADYLTDPSALRTASPITLEEYTDQSSAPGQPLREAVATCLSDLADTMMDLLRDMIQADELAFTEWKTRYENGLEGTGRLHLWSVTKGRKNTWATPAPIHAYKRLPAVERAHKEGQQVNEHMEHNPFAESGLDIQVLQSASQSSAWSSSTNEGQRRSSQDYVQHLQKLRSWKSEAERLGYIDPQVGPSRRTE